MLATQPESRARGFTLHKLHPLRAPNRPRIRSRLRRRAALIKHLAIIATDRIEAVDPESAVYFLRLLRERCDEAIRSATS